jgi:4-amino-4-deoxy-L-arabinose transferase-like glycosyltransferase
MEHLNSRQEWRWASSPWLVNLLLPTGIAGLFFVLSYAYYPLHEKFLYDTDEGMNLMRSMLVALGHPLYDAVSSDQPPLFTHLLALLFRIVGFEVNPARALVLLFSALIVWAGAYFLQLSWGKLPALAFAGMLIMVPDYLRLSVSVMIGIPAIALAVLALLCLGFWHRRRQRIWLILSGSVLALSMLTKLFTGFLVPIFLIGLTLAEWNQDKKAGFRWALLRPALIWSLSFASIGLLLGWLSVGPQNLAELLTPHLAAGANEVFQGQKFVLETDMRSTLLLLLGLLGVVQAILNRRWLALYPAAWTGSAYLILHFYTPVFYHHQLLITIPAAMLAAGTVGEGLAWLISRRRLVEFWHIRTVLAATALVGVALVWKQAQPVLVEEIRDEPRVLGFALQATPGKLEILAAMRTYAEETHWILTDMPIYAFRIKRPVPPVLATVSLKRLATGSLSEQDILKALQEYQPEQVLMERFYFPALEAALPQNYTLVLEREDLQLFIRNDLAARYIVN